MSYDMADRRPDRGILFTFGVFVALGAGVALGCASASPVRVGGSPADLEILAGEWTGTYSSPDTGREGSIWFKLVAGEDLAHGDVLMTPRGRSHAYARYGEKATGQERTQFLSIRFARVSGGEVEGALEPYWDPDCGCQARTDYRGRLAGDTFAGTFVTSLGSGGIARGQWTATRRRR